MYLMFLIKTNIAKNWEEEKKNFSGVFSFSMTDHNFRFLSIY